MTWKAYCWLLVLLVGSSPGQLNTGTARPSARNITIAGSTTLKSGAGTLHTLTVNSAGGNPCTAVLYDSTTNSGTKLATVDCTSSRTLTYEFDFQTGLTIDTTGDQQPADMTVVLN